MRNFSGYHFYMNAKVLGGFQICISVPLKFQEFRNLDQAAI